MSAAVEIGFVKCTSEHTLSTFIEIKGEVNKIK